MQAGTRLTAVAVVAVATVAGTTVASAQATSGRQGDGRSVTNVIYFLGDGMGRTHVTAARER